jgi:hypothetical protein
MSITELLLLFILLPFSSAGIADTAPAPELEASPEFTTTTPEETITLYSGTACHSGDLEVIGLYGTIKKGEKEIPVCWAFDPFKDTIITTYGGESFKLDRDQFTTSCNSCGD